MIIWLRKQPKAKVNKYVGSSLFLVLSISSAFYLFNNGDLSNQRIHDGYEINSIDEIKALAIDSDKILYVDFWYSGCKPCLEEFINHHEFRKQINSEKVDFLFV